MATFDTAEMKRDFFDVLKEFRENKEKTSELNQRNRELTKYLDETFQLEKGTAKAWIRKKLAEEKNADRTEDVVEVESLIGED